MKDINILNRISCHKFVEIDGYAYFSNWFYNGLFKVEIETGKAFFLGKFKAENYFEINIHGEIFRIGKKIYFCPRRGRHLHIYDLETQEMNAIKIREKFEKFSIGRVIVEASKVYFVPVQNKISVKKLDLKTLNVIEEDKKNILYSENEKKYNEMFLPNKVSKEQGIKESDIFYGKHIDDERWLTFHPRRRQIIQYNKVEKKVKLIEIFVVNDKKLKKHLYKVREELKSDIIDKIIWEQRLKIDLYEYVSIIKSIINLKDIKKSKCSVGDDIWESVVSH